MQETTEPRDLEGRIEELAAAIRTVKEMGRRHAMAIVEAGRLAKEVKEELALSFSEAAELRSPIERNSLGQAVPGWLYQGLTEFSGEKGHNGTPDKRGWQALCEERLGVSYKTADRYIEDFEAWEELRERAAMHGMRTAERAQALLEQVECGELRAARAWEALEAGALLEEEQPPDPKQWAHLARALHTEEELARFEQMETAALAGDMLAAQNLMAAARGEVSIGRAYAGWRGGRATRGKARRDPDHSRLLVRNINGVYRSVERWETLDASSRDEFFKVMRAMFGGERCPHEIRLFLAQILEETEDWA